AQEAHEAIRPTSISRHPTSLKSKLTADQFRLYELIWKRALASQIKHATIDTVSVDMACGAGNVFRATGSTIVEMGYMAVYQESTDDNGSEGGDGKFPPVEKGEQIPVKQIRTEQHFTEPPPRYSEASLVKTLEEYGIGRPSTYASIISTLGQRGYVEMDKKRFVPTDVGRIVNRFLTEHFSDYVDYDFTARLEDELDAVSRGEESWIPLMHRFWQPFSRIVKEKEESVSRSDVAQARVLGTDPKTGLPVSVRMGRYGPFAQIGTRDDANKPKFAGLRPSQRIDLITLGEALDLFKLPRALGQTPEGEEIVVNIGRYGPYVRFGSRFASLKKEDDPYSIDLNRALDLIQEKKTADAAKRIKVFDGSNIAILNGRYGPYITDGTKNARIPKGRDPGSLTLDESKALLEQAPSARPRRGAARKKA
ncbi:MAG: DNA topoisomerase, partial [Gammaproteobacteria bacterium]